MDEGRRSGAVVESLEGRVLLSGSGAGPTAWAVHYYGTAIAVTDRAVRPLAEKSASIAQPDILLRDYQYPTPASYNGDNTYSTNGANQSLAQNTGFFPQIYQLAVQNDGNRADSFALSGGGGTKSGWRVSYFDSQIQGGNGGNNITAAVNAGTYRTPTLQPGEMFEFRVEVGPASFAPGGSVRQVNVTATSVNDPSKVDVISTVTTDDLVRGVQIRRRNFDASGLYQIDIENTGNNKDRVRVFGESGGTGWTVHYYDAFQGGNDVTAQVINGGWISNRITYGNSIPLLVKITATDGQVHTAQVIAQSFVDGSKSDVTYVSNAPTQARLSFFPIAVFSQPAYSFDGWKSRGINTMFNYESQGGTVSMAEWSQVAADKKLYIIRQPSANPADDVGEKNLLAWAFADEPDVPGHSGYVTPSEMISQYQQLKAIDPTRPILGNFDGSDVVQWQTDVSVASYQQYVMGTDWDSQGMYPINGWNRVDDLNIAAKAVDDLQNWSGGKMQWAILENSPQMAPFTPKGTPGPTTGQFRAQVWDSVIHGAQGIMYFPQQLGPSFGYDNTPADIATEMTTQNATLTQFGAALESPIDPPTLGLVTPPPIEGTWRTFGGKTYYFVLNMSSVTLKKQPMALQGVGRGKTAVVAGENRSIALDKHGNFSDTFGPYQLHIYQVS